MKRLLRKLAYWIPVLGFFLPSWSKIFKKCIADFPRDGFTFKTSVVWHTFWLVVILVNAIF